MGETVNLAARLEAHTKAVGEPILIDQATKDQLDSAIITQAQGMFQAKGKAQEVAIFSVPVGQNR